MSIRKVFQPRPTISDNELNDGLRWWTWEGTTSLGFNSITTSGFLAAFALALGANNFQIGILAAIPFLMQILQIPSIWLVEKFRRRKLIAVAAWYPAQVLWFPIALIPVLIDVPSGWAISMLIFLIAIRGLLNAVCNSAWNGWIRDLIPQQVLGQLFSKRLAWATLAGVVFSLGTAFFVDYWRGHAATENAALGYTYVLLFGALFLGLASPTFMSLMPEPLMQPAPGPQPPLTMRLTAPVRNVNFRRLVQFLLFWGFASNLAIPFFAVYMLTRLGLPLSLVIGLSILSQIFNMLFLRVWGRFVDRFGNKAVLSLCASLYLLVILGWIFTTMPERYFLTMPLLVLLHIFAGIANAGVTLNVGTIGLKLAPRGEATAYLASASIATNLGAGLGPLCGGVLADYFSVRQLNLTLTWIDPASSVQVPALSIIGFDFLFGIAFVLGLMTLSTLARLHEEGEVSREVVLESLMNPMREFSRPMSSVPAYNLLSNFPFGYLKRVPVPGLDVVLGVTAYQIAEVARVATLAAVRGRRISRKLGQALLRGLTGAREPQQQLEEHGVEIARQAARGAMHVIDDKPLVVDQLTTSVVISVVEAVQKTGVPPADAILGTSQGVVQGAMETNINLSTAARHVIAAARQMAAKSGLPEEMAVARATEGMLQAAEAIGPEAVAEVAEYLFEEETLPAETKIKRGQK
ncbi:MAG TPA: MFS transporter [Dehalococcoidia bacterium]|nr:MFS transporter [Dehalococcoidia bacterium]